MTQAHRIPRRHFLNAFVAGVLVLGTCEAWAQTLPSLRLGDLLGRRFIENAGQWPAEVRFATGSGVSRTWVTPRGLAFLLVDPATGRSTTVMLELAATGPIASRGETPGSGRFNFLRGSDPRLWRTGVDAYDSVVFESGGMRLHARPTAAGTILELETAPDEGPSEFMVRLVGAILAEGAEHAPASVDTLLGKLRQRCKSCGHVLACDTCGGGFRVTADGLLRWAPAPAAGSPGRKATVGLEWSTFLAGENSDRITAAGFAGDDSVIFGGNTFSMDFPTTPGSFDPTHAPPNPLFSNYDVVVGRLTPDGTDLVYSTFVAGEANDECRGLIVAEDDEPIVLAAIYGSVDYPTSPGAFDSTAEFSDAAITRLLSDGSGLRYSTFLGGSSAEQPLGIALADDEGVVVVGETYSADFPTTPGAYDTTLFPQANNQDGFVSKLAPDGESLLFSTYLGASGTQWIEGVAVFPDGTLALTGVAGAPDFPVTPGTVQSDFGSSFVARMSSDGSALVWSTYFGGNSAHRAHDIAVDAAGNVTVAGTVEFLLPGLTEFPTTPGAFDPTWNGSSDVYVSRIDPTGTQLLWSTVLGGGGQDTGWDIVVDAAGMTTVFGATRSGDFPATTGAYDDTHNNDWDFFTARLAPDGDRLFYGTFVGGSNHEPYLTGKEMDGALDSEGEAVIVGATRSLDYPATPGAFETRPDGSPGTDGVVTRLTLLPAGVTGLGASTPGCSGSMTIGVSALPNLGSEDFGLWCSGAQPFNSRGFLGVSLAPLDQPLTAAGAELWLDPATLLALPVTSDATGFCELPLRIEDDPALVGLQGWVQFFWRDPCGPAGWAASRSLGITLQP